MTFVTWTQFGLPKSVLFNVGIPYNTNPEYDSRLLDAVRLILHAPEHIISAWGRVSERPEEIILVSCETRSYVPHFLQVFTNLHVSMAIRRLL